MMSHLSTKILLSNSAQLLEYHLSSLKFSPDKISSRCRYVCSTTARKLTNSQAQKNSDEIWLVHKRTYRQLSISFDESSVSKERTQETSTYNVYIGGQWVQNVFDVALLKSSFWNIHPFNLYPENWFEGYSVKSTL